MRVMRGLKPLSLLVQSTLVTHSIVAACSKFENHICCSSDSPFESGLNYQHTSNYQTNTAGLEIENSMTEISGTNRTLPTSLRILCFGDSLTAGYTMSGWEHYPYADHLRVGLEHMLSSSDIIVDVAGLSGDQVQGQYLSRIKAKCASAVKAPYDWIIVMGGTNDLGWGQQPDTIYEGLSERFSSNFVLVFHPI